MASKVVSLLKPNQVATIYSRSINCWAAGITKKHRRVYTRTYPTILQDSDGSTINIQYHQPVEVARLPLDLSKLTPAEMQARLYKRIPKTKVVIQEEIEDEFDEERYLKYQKKK